jgi:pimeloyl-ACP methyl ester carboxylesterase
VTRCRLPRSKCASTRTQQACLMDGEHSQLPRLRVRRIAKAFSIRVYASRPSSLPVYRMARYGKISIQTPGSGGPPIPKRSSAKGKTMMRTRERSVATNGLDMHILEAGEGKPLLLPHGGTLTSASWSDFMPVVAERYYTVAPGSRGHGRTANPTGRLSYRGMADDVAGLIKELELRDPLVIGYSDGGQIALELALRHPGLAGALVIAGASHRVGSEYFNSLKAWGFPSAGTVDLDQMQRDNPQWLDQIRTLHVGDGESDYWRELLRQISHLWYSWQDYHLDQLRDIASPTLIYLGDRDELNELDQAVEMYHAMPNAELAIVPNANHSIAVDQLHNPSSSLSWSASRTSRSASTVRWRPIAGRLAELFPALESAAYVRPRGRGVAAADPGSTGRSSCSERPHTA